MYRAIRLIALPLAPALLSACTGIPYDRATNSDITPPAISLRVEGQDPSSRYLPAPTANDGACYPKQGSDFCPNVRITPVEVGRQVLGSPIISIRIHENGEASVLASASDDGSGIEMLTLQCQRHVYYNWDPNNQTEADALLPVEQIRQDNTIQNGRVPEAAILQKVLNMRNLLSFRNNNTVIRGHRVVANCNAETKNFNGQGLFSQPLVIWAEDRAIKP